MNKLTNFPVVPLEEIPASEYLADAGPCRPMVLVVDGEHAAADALTGILNRCGYAAIAAYDGQVALETALLMPPDLVIAVVEMPGMGGVELSMALREELPDCGFLLLSGQSSTPKPEARGAHKLEVLSKPVPASELLARVSAILG